MCGGGGSASLNLYGAKHTHWRRGEAGAVASLRGDAAYPSAIATPLTLCWFRRVPRPRPCIDQRFEDVSSGGLGRNAEWSTTALLDAIMRTDVDV